MERIIDRMFWRLDSRSWRVNADNCRRCFFQEKRNGLFVDAFALQSLVSFRGLGDCGCTVDGFLIVKFCF